MAIGWKGQTKKLALCVLAAEVTGVVHRGRHTPQPGGAKLVKGNLHNGNKCVLRRDAQRLESPLSATKLTVSGP